MLLIFQFRFFVTKFILHHKFIRYNVIYQPKTVKKNMGNNENGGRIPIIVALIGLIGTITVAIIAKLPNLTFETSKDKSDSIKPSIATPDSVKVSQYNATTQLPEKRSIARVNNALALKQEAVQPNYKKEIQDVPLNIDAFCSLIVELNKARKSNYQDIKGAQKVTTEKYVKTYYTTLSTEFSTSLTEFIREEESKKYFRMDIEIESLNKSLYNDVCNTIDRCLDLKIERSSAGKWKEGLINFADGGYIDVESESKGTYITFGQSQNL